MFTRKPSMLIVSLVLPLLVSCDAGIGSFSLAGTPVPPPLPPPANAAALPITAVNAQDITVTVLGAITSTIEIIDIVDVVGVPAVGDIKPGLAKLAVSDIFMEVVLCDSGEADVTWDDADNNLDISTGDTFDIVFAMCFFEGPGLTLDGPTSLTNLEVTGDPFNLIAPWVLKTTFGFDDLSVTDGIDTLILGGNLNLDLSTDDNIVVDSLITTASLTTQYAGITETLSDYVLTQTLDLNASTRTLSADGTLTSTLLEGSVTFETLQEFAGTFEDNPSTGQLLISDASSSVLVIVLDNISVQLDIDVDLDGMIDETIVVTWAELDID